MDDVEGAPIELIALDTPYQGTISARRRGEESLRWVNGIGDAIMAAMSRGVDLVVPTAMFDEISDEFPPDLPPYIKVV
ncbi:MAG: hypothetical protein ACJ72D_07690 [Marmoricola sp.]